MFLETGRKDQIHLCEVDCDHGKKMNYNRTRNYSVIMLGFGSCCRRSENRDWEHEDLEAGEQSVDDSYSMLEQNQRDYPIVEKVMEKPCDKEIITSPATEAEGLPVAHTEKKALETTAETHAGTEEFVEPMIDMKEIARIRAERYKKSQANKAGEE